MVLARERRASLVREFMSNTSHMFLPLRSFFFFPPFRSPLLFSLVSFLLSLCFYMPYVPCPSLPFFAPSLPLFAAPITFIRFCHSCIQNSSHLTSPPFLILFSTPHFIADHVLLELTISHWRASWRQSAAYPQVALLTKPCNSFQTHGERGVRSLP